MRVLVVEDELDLAQALVGHLRDAGYAVDHAATLADARAAQGAMHYALILLDLQLPDGKGLTLLKEIRATGDATPVLIASAFDQISDRIIGLEAGADDYLVKPYDLDEMVARISAILRRFDADYRPERRFGPIAIHPTDRIVTLNGAAVALTRKEWAILDRLSRRPGVTVSKADLEDALYDFGQEIESNAIEAHISRLRTKLGRRAIETVRGFGYRIGQGETGQGEVGQGEAGQG